MTAGIINLNFNVERIYEMPEVTPGKVYRLPVTVQPGGKGVNVARVLKTLRMPFVLTGCLGGFSGGWIARDLKRSGIASVPFSIKGESRTCLALSDLRTSRQTVINEEGPALSQRETRSLRRHLDGFLDGKSAAVFSGSAPRGISPAEYAGFVRLAVKRRIPAVVDIGGLFLRAAIEAAPAVIKPNEHEWQEACGRRLRTFEDFRRSARAALRKGVQWVVISRAEQGVLVFGKERSLEVRVPRLAAVNTVGCGDALAAGIACGIERGWTEERIFHFAAAVSAAHALTSVPGMVRREDVTRVAKDITLRVR